MRGVVAKMSHMCNFKFGSLVTGLAGVSCHGVRAGTGLLSVTKL